MPRPRHLPRCYSVIDTRTAVVLNRILPSGAAKRRGASSEAKPSCWSRYTAALPLRLLRMKPQPARQQASCTPASKVDGAASGALPTVRPLPPPRVASHDQVETNVRTHLAWQCNQQAALTHIIRHIVTYHSSLDAIRRTLRAGADTSPL